MIEKFSSKVLDKQELSRTVSNFNVADAENIDSAELKTMYAHFKKEAADLTSQLSALKESSGYNSIAEQLARVLEVNDSILQILSNRIEDDSLDDKSLVILTRDEVVDSADGEQTTEAVDTVVMFYDVIKYREATIEEHRALKRLTISEEDMKYNFIHKLVDLSLSNVLLFCKKYLSDIDGNVASEIIEKNYEWHTILSGITISKAKLNASLKMYPDKRDVLISEGYVIRELQKEEKSPTNSQMSIFDEYDTEVVNVLTEGDDNNVEVNQPDNTQSE